jgi:hypothetical protein
MFLYLTFSSSVYMTSLDEYSDSYRKGRLYAFIRFPDESQATDATRSWKGDCPLGLVLVRHRAIC